MLQLTTQCTFRSLTGILFETANIYRVNINYSRNNNYQWIVEYWNLCLSVASDDTMVCIPAKNIGWVNMIIIMYWDTFHNTHTTDSMKVYIPTKHPSHILKLYFTALRFIKFIPIFPFSLNDIRRTHIDCMPYIRSIFQFPYKSVPFFHLELISCAKLFKTTHR